MECYLRYAAGINHVDEMEKKRMSFEERTQIILASYDAQDLTNQYQKRMAFYPLHDYFHLHILEIGVRFCGIPEVALKSCSIKVRWEHVKDVLSEIGNIPSEWDQVIRTLHNLRNKLAHEDAVPNIRALEFIRSKAEEFSKWIIESGGNYFVQSSGFPLIQRFKKLARWYVNRADSILSEYGKTVPHYVLGNLRWTKEVFFIKIKSLKASAAHAGKSITSVAEITSSNLDGLISLITEIERLDARECVYLEFNICPLCGSKIVSSQQTLGGSFTDPVPTEIHYRIGCEKCDYEVMYETVQV